jgi:hypothetical protein
MRYRKGLLRWGMVLAFPFLVGALCLNSSFAINQSTWSNKHISNYTMDVQTLALPSPAVDVQVVVRNGKVADEKLLECEIGQSEYSADMCKAITTYYYAPGGRFTHTMDDLFQIAQSCTEATKIIVAKYGIPYQIGFTGFTSLDAMRDFERAYGSSLQSFDWLCSVQYDLQYGYPTEIIYQAPPTVLDGTSIIMVKNFHVDD